MINVSCAIIVKEERILVVQRGPGTSHPFQWEFPGGKVREKETAEESILREIQEELSVEIEVLGQLRTIEHDYGIKQIRLIPFLCRIKSGSLQLTEHIASRWILPGETHIPDWSEADRKLIGENNDFFSNRKTD
ncbi:MAG: (deoxy)nucleoside triphosphate pyrophosphohydrolase [Prolixibacteraceae bacterium]|jgi:8-oxo-dGTP diphosphatase|nr:(deoxy)nucleoside triphosphate pyrophosphohydrolase [Prolixibacteraceae bacterium]